MEAFRDIVVTLSYRWVCSRSREVCRSALYVKWKSWGDITARYLDDTLYVLDHTPHVRSRDVED